jgi:hypothetical protein
MRTGIARCQYYWYALAAAERKRHDHKVRIAEFARTARVHGGAVARGPLLLRRCLASPI